MTVENFNISVESDFDPPTIYEQLVALESQSVPFVLVTLVESIGSVPQDDGAKMLVTLEGLYCGTIGGGKLEAKALGLARGKLDGKGKACLVTWTLKSDVGMTCGGSVKLYFEPHHAMDWPIVIFGAGHIAQALVPLLLPLACSLTVIDLRLEWLEKLPSSRRLRPVHLAEPATAVDDLPDNAYVICMTQGHGTDLPILHRALVTRSFPFVGVIGSKAKAAVLRRDLIATGIALDLTERVHCPIGLDFGGNHPHEIALSIAAQLLTVRDRRIDC